MIGDRIVVSYALRSGGRATFPGPLQSWQGLQIPCTRCGTHWWPKSVTEPTNPPEHLGFDFTDSKVTALLAHNARETEAVA